MLHGDRNMRLIGRLNTESSAKTFGDYLTCLDIRNNLEPEPDGRWAVWVFSEDQLEASYQALAEYVQNPGDAKFTRASEKAGAMRRREQKEQDEFAKRVVTRDTMWGSFGLGPLTLALIGVCVMVALVGLPPASTIWAISGQARFLPEIRRGELWRLITPIFVHMSVFHLLFNMLWLKTLGSMIEDRLGTLKLLLLVVTIAAGSNLGQNIVSGPEFGGMSGVLYGLFGFIWMRGKFDPASGLHLNPADIFMMVGWFFLCLFHVIPHVANGAHGFGLVMGMIWGAAPPLARKLLKL
jgi:GlpG protein